MPAKAPPKVFSSPDKVEFVENTFERETDEQN
jgi:hypothetical protein